MTGAAPHLHAFKTPTARNVALTAPYMHNGVFRTLEEVVDFYDRGGGAGIGIALENQTLPAERLQTHRAGEARAGGVHAGVDGYDGVDGALTGSDSRRPRADPLCWCASSLGDSFAEPHPGA